MTQHTDLIERLYEESQNNPDDDRWKAADALEAQAREIAELKAQLAATAKNAFEAMPHDIPLRMKREICVSAAWSGSMVSRMYTELRKAFTGEPYKANEDLDAALLEVARLRKDAALVAAREREALLVEMRSGEVQLPMQVAARWPSVPGSHKYAGACGCQPGSFGADSEDLFTTAQLLDYGDRRAAAAIRALNTEGEGNDRP